MAFDVTDVLLSILKIAIILGIWLNITPIMVWVERRGSALIQDRPGPNRVVSGRRTEPVAREAHTSAPASGMVSVFDGGVTSSSSQPMPSVDMEAVSAATSMVTAAIAKARKSPSTTFWPHAAQAEMSRKNRLRTSSLCLHFGQR